MSLSTPFGGGSATFEHVPTLKPFWRQKARALTQWLAEHGAGLLLTIDEVHAIPREELRALSTEVQHLIRERTPIGLFMVGLPKAVEELLNDDITTFLCQAERIELGEVVTNDVCDASKSTLDAGEKALSNDLAQGYVNATGGYSFMIQLVGHQVWKHSGDGPVAQPAVATGTTAARLRLGNLVYALALRNLSDADRTMLVCTAKDDGPSQIADIAEHMNRPVNYVSVYRNRLFVAGIIKTAGCGKADFAASYLREYLREHAAHLVMG